MIYDYQFDTQAISLVMGVPCPGHWCTNGIYDSSVFEWRSTPSLICYMLWAQVYIWPLCYLQGSMDASYICYLQLVDYLLYDMICYVSGLVVDYCPISDFMRSNTFNHNSRHFIPYHRFIPPRPITSYKVVHRPTTDSRFSQHWIWTFWYDTLIMIWYLTPSFSLLPFIHVFPLLIGFSPFS
jgi:hypothetical protein